MSRLGVCVCARNGTLRVAENLEEVGWVPVGTQLQPHGELCVNGVGLKGHHVL